MAKVTKKKLKDYLQDSKNFNRGTEYGTGLIARSVSKFGAGRSMLASSDGVLVAGNKSHQALADAGIENVIEVETDGKTAVVVKRTDIKSGTKKFHELALADNATSKANLNFDETLVEEILTEEVMLEWGINHINYSLGHPANNLTENDLDFSEEFDPIGLSKGQQRVVLIFKNQSDAEEWLKQFPLLKVKKNANAWHLEMNIQSI